MGELIVALTLLEDIHSTGMRIQDNESRRKISEDMPGSRLRRTVAIPEIEKWAQHVGVALRSCNSCTRNEHAARRQTDSPEELGGHRIHFTGSLYRIDNDPVDAIQSDQIAVDHKIAPFYRPAGAAPLKLALQNPHMLAFEMIPLAPRGHGGNPPRATPSGRPILFHGFLENVRPLSSLAREGNVIELGDPALEVQFHLIKVDSDLHRIKGDHHVLEPTQLQPASTLLGQFIAALREPLGELSRIPLGSRHEVISVRQHHRSRKTRCPKARNAKRPSIDHGQQKDPWHTLMPLSRKRHAMD